MTNENKLALVTDTIFIDHTTSSSHRYFYRITTEDIHGNQSTPTAELSATATEVIDNLLLPATTALLQNYPNPFNPTTVISFQLSALSYTNLKIFDLMGREVTTLVSEILPAGTYTRQWNATGCASGMYFYRLQTGSFSDTKKLIIMR